jgi:Radical SAM superfamily/4Fe-4S single cluster domain
MELALVITARCNAACGHCSTGCSPYRKEALGKTEIIRLMDDASRIDDGEALQFHLTGGEPFLNFPLLLEVVAHGSSLKAGVSCVTNAYWAKTAEVAKEKLAALKDAGLTSLAVSVSRFHERYVPRRNARLALEAARDLKLLTELKGAIIMSDLDQGGLLAIWKRELDADEVNITPVIPYLREGSTLPDSEFYRRPGLPKLKCPGAITCVEADGAVMSCCGQSPQTGFLAIGDVRQDSLATLHERFVGSPKQRILREMGPIAFANQAIAAGLKGLLRDSYAGPCDLCVHIGTEPELRRVADQMAATYRSASKKKRTGGRKPIQRSFNHTTILAPLARRLQMSETELEQLKNILVEAASNPEFRGLLLSNPGGGGKGFTGADLSAEALEILNSLTPDVRRIGEEAALQQVEAENWAIGLLVLNVTRRRHQDWKVAITDIPRYRKKHKFSVQVGDIPRRKKAVRVSVADIPRISSKKPAKKRPIKRAAKPK